jgi:hypothetical protein
MCADRGRFLQDAELGRLGKRLARDGRRVDPRVTKLGDRTATIDFERIPLPLPDSGDEQRAANSTTLELSERDLKARSPVFKKTFVDMVGGFRARLLAEFVTMTPVCSEANFHVTYYARPKWEKKKDKIVVTIRFAIKMNANQ